MASLKKQSRLLIKTLRHDLVKLGLCPNEEGYVSVLDLQEKVPALKALTMENVQEICASDDKGRFGLKVKEERVMYIRANQGHSKEVGDHIEMTPLKEPIKGVFHGSYAHLEASIKEKGLLPMSRKHIHIARSLDAKSGKRHDCTLLVYIDMEQAMFNGITFYESQNGVILTEGPLDPKYLTFRPV